VAVNLTPVLTALGLNWLYCPLYVVALFITALLSARVLEAATQLLSRKARPARAEKRETREPPLVSGEVSVVHRYHAIDGLRGFLALGILAHHIVIYYVAMRDGQWCPPQSSLFDALGGGCVAYFFMITAFLFWGKARNKLESVGYRKLIPSRISRLMPMYLVSYALMLFLVFIASGGQLHQSLSQMMAAICAGAMGGIFGTPTVNQIDPGIFDCHVIWSLQYEWFFYLSLPILARFLRGRNFVLIPLVMLSACLLQPNNAVLACLMQFVVGMVAAVLCVDATRSAIFRSRWFAILALVACAATVCNFDNLPMVVRPLGLAPLFFAVANGFDIFGLLTTRGAQLLGRISYSVYLLHGIVLYAFTWLLSGFFPVENMSPEAYWLACLGLTLLLVPVCTLTFSLFEAPFMKRRDYAGAVRATAESAVVESSASQLLAGS
jgi:peptidoglycan/LPS O-acetylase OafA/YrhL